MRMPERPSFGLVRNLVAADGSGTARVWFGARGRVRGWWVTPPGARRRPKERRRMLTRLGIALALLPALAGGAIAPTGAAPLGGGAYEVDGAVYGTAADGLVGGTTASGQILRGGDRLVALPACTVSSCPWVPPGAAPVEGWGAQTSCAEADGLCWVELSSAETGACAVAPVLDLGPFFRADTWWAPAEERVYGLEQGVPAAEAAGAGADLGYGPGMGEDGVDVAALGFAPALSIAAGTWADLGLGEERGAAPLQVRLLWQAGLFHQEACGGATGLPAENAVSRTDLALFAAPDGGESLRTVPAGRRLAVTGEPRDGFYPVTHGATTGWAAGDALLFDGGDPGAVLYTSEQVNLRNGPRLANDVLRELPAGTRLARTGPAVDGFVPVAHGGMVGWVAEDYLR